MINKVVIPAAGEGKRLRPITNFIPKELLPVGQKPMISYCIQEAIECGISNICIVIRKEKKLIRKYIEDFLRDKEVNITFRYQKKPQGIADAIYKAKDFIGNSWFCILVPDLLFFGKKSAISQIIELWKQERKNIVGLYQLKAKDKYLFDIFGINDAIKIDSRKYIITYLYEKNPNLRKKIKEGTMIVTPPYIVSSSYFKLVEDMNLENKKEIDDGPILRSLMKEGQVLGVPLKGTLFDSGNPRGYQAACRFFFNNFFE